MTLAHLSDTHLGFRAYARTAPGGFNQREVDVADSFERCLDAILERDPDLVVHAGDFFHVVRPGNGTIVRAYRALTRFQSQRQGKPFLLIGGNHDTPRTSDSGNLLQLFTAIEGVRLYPREVTRDTLPELDLEILAVPSPALKDAVQQGLEPLGTRGRSLLILHGMTRQALPHHADLDIDQVRHDRWSYVALGDYHVFQRYGENVAYSGATDFSSTNVWEEAGRPKGWVWYEEGKALEFVPSPTRPIYDLPALDATDWDPSTLANSLTANAVWGDDEVPIVRQRVTNLHPAVRSAIDSRVIREIAARCLHYQLQTSPPPRRSYPSSSGAMQVETLERSWEVHVEDADLPKNVSREKLKTLGLELLREVAENEADPASA